MEQKKRSIQRKNLTQIKNLIQCKNPIQNLQAILIRSRTPNKNQLQKRYLVLGLYHMLSQNNIQIKNLIQTRNSIQIHNLIRQVNRIPHKRVIPQRKFIIIKNHEMDGELFGHWAWALRGLEEREL